MSACQMLCIVTVHIRSFNGISALVSMATALCLPMPKTTTATEFAMQMLSYNKTICCCCAEF